MIIYVHVYFTTNVLFQRQNLIYWLIKSFLYLIQNRTCQTKRILFSITQCTEKIKFYVSSTVKPVLAVQLR